MKENGKTVFLMDLVQFVMMMDRCTRVALSMGWLNVRTPFSLRILLLSTREVSRTIRLTDMGSFRLPNSFIKVTGLTICHREKRVRFIVLLPFMRVTSSMGLKKGMGFINGIKTNIILESLVIICSRGKAI